MRSNLSKKNQALVLAAFAASGFAPIVRTGREIANIAALSDPALRTKLRALHVNVADDATRSTMIRAARDANVWDYRGDVVPAHFKARYGKEQNCGDDVAKHLVGCEVEFLQDVADANGIDFHRWDHCNRGQLTMNLGNVLRGRIKRGEYVIVGITEWNPDAA